MTGAPKYKFPVAAEVAAQQRAQQDELCRLRAMNALLLAALQAIMARLEGEFDNPALMAIGPLTTTDADIGTIASAAIQVAKR